MPLLIALIVTLAMFYIINSHRSPKPALQKVQALPKRKVARDDRDW